MAYNRSDELKKKINGMSLGLKTASVLKYIFLIYAFISFFFWFLNCFEPDWLYMFNWLFAVPYRLVRFIYKPSGIGADFSLAIIGTISLISGIICEIILNNSRQKLKTLTEKYEKISGQKKNVKKKAAKPIPGGSREFPNMRGIFIPEITQEDSIILVFIIHLHIHKFKTNPDDADYTFEESEALRKRVNKKILANVKYSQQAQPMQKGYYRKNLFFTYKDFNYIDDFINYMNPAVQNVIQEFKSEGADVQFGGVLSAIAQVSALEKELDLMDTILSLNFINKFIFTDSFNKAYEIKAVKSHTLVKMGEYNLSKNLAISNIQELYEFTDLQK